MVLLPWKEYTEGIGSNKQSNYRRASCTDDVCWAIVRQFYTAGGWQYSIAGLWSIDYKSAEDAKRACDIELIDRKFRLISDKIAVMI